MNSHNGDELFNDMSLPQKLFNGKRNITRVLAEKIIPYLNKGLFIDFLSSLNGNLDQLKKSFNISSDVSDEVFFDILCARFFGFIYKAVEITNKPGIPQKYNSEFAIELFPKTSAISAFSLKKNNIDVFFHNSVVAKEFINREHPRQLFYDIWNNVEISDKNVIMYYGIGGIGKSSLVKNLKEYVTEHKGMMTSVDFDDPAVRTPYMAMLELEKNLHINLPHFDIAVSLYFIKRNTEINSHSNKLPNEITRYILRSIEENGKNSTSFLNELSGIIQSIYSEYSCTLKI
ncbi:MAG: ATP-binding protein [Oscillospiraceae bacterium]|jgi:hypothetical protein|nr:ATP-binding protein [Oscillospiraceae bacterium]